MPLKLNEPIVLAESQDITVSNISIFKKADVWVSRVFYSITNGDGEVIKEDMLEYEGEAFNVWWTGFQSGVFLYSEYIQKKKLSITPEAKSDDDFKNIKAAQVMPIDEIPVDAAVDVVGGSTDDRK